MSNVEVTPDNLRETADTFSAASHDILGATAMGGADSGARIEGMGGHRAYNLSTQQFEPGAKAQQLVLDAIGDFGEVNLIMQTNCLGLSSALHILADVYSSADHEEALAFAFLEPGADRPAGLASHVQDESLIDDPTDPTADPPAEALTDGDGGSAGDAPRSETDSYSTNMGRPGTTYQVEETIHYDADGNPASADYVFTYADGSTGYYTQTFDANGNPEGLTEQYTVPTQPEPAEPGTAMQQDMEIAMRELDQVTD